jgi:hypothetical protein
MRYIAALLRIEKGDGVWECLVGFLVIAANLQMHLALYRSPQKNKVGGLYRPLSLSPAIDGRFLQ